VPTRYIRRELLTSVEGIPKQARLARYAYSTKAIGHKPVVQRQIASIKLEGAMTQLFHSLFAAMELLDEQWAFFQWI
jgi:hypothetical protein